MYEKIKIVKRKILKVTDDYLILVVKYHKAERTFIVEKYLITLNVIAFQCVINDNYGGCRSKVVHMNTSHGPFRVIETLVTVLFHPFPVVYCHDEE